MATISIDGTSTELVDLYAPGAVDEVSVWSVSGLEDTTHTVQFTWTGLRNANSTGTVVDIDAFDVVGSLLDAAAPLYAYTRYDDDATEGIYEGTWTTWGDQYCYDESLHQTDQTGTAFYAFKGSAVELIGLTGSSEGVMSLSFDGGTAQDIDLYSTSTAYQENVWYSTGLSDTTHTVEVEWTGRKNASSTGTTITIDAIDVCGQLIADTAPPVTTDDAEESYVGTATVTLTAVDDARGVDETYYSLDGGTWSTGASIEATAIGQHTLDYYSVDKLGKQEATKTCSFIVYAGETSITQVSEGTITGSNTWGASGSPYVISGAVELDSSAVS